MSGKKKRRRSLEMVDDKERLQLFLEQADELRSRPMVEGKVGFKVPLFAGSPEYASMNTSFPDEELLRSFAVNFRLFIAEGSPVHVYSVFEICFDNLKSDSELRYHFEKARIDWSKALNHSGMRLTFYERELSTPHIRDLWMNGDLLHIDLHKKSELRRMHDSQRMLVKANFVASLIEGADVIFRIRNLIDYALRNNHFRF